MATATPRFAGSKADDVAHPHVAAKNAGVADGLAVLAHSPPRWRARLLGLLAACSRLTFKSRSSTSKAGSPSNSMTKLPSQAVILRVLEPFAVKGWQPWDTRDSSKHLVAERHAAQTARKHAAGRALTFDVVIASHGKLHALAAAGGKTAKQVARAGAVAQLGNHFCRIGHVAVRMNQSRVRLKCWGRQLFE